MDETTEGQLTDQFVHSETITAQNVNTTANKDSHLSKESFPGLLETYYYPIIVREGDDEQTRDASANV